MHGQACYLRMELNAISRGSIAKRLIFKMLAPGKKLRLSRQCEAFPMPLINFLRPVIDSITTVYRVNGIVTNLNALLRMAANSAAQMLRQHLCPKAHAQKWLLLFQRNTNPFDLAGNPGLGIIGAHRTAKDNSTRMLIHRFK